MAIAQKIRETIPRRDRSEPCPLSFPQERVWFLNQLEPDSPAYNQPKAVRLSGVLDIGALKKALDALVERHEILRTRFLAPNGDPVQVVGPVQSIDLPLIDLSALAVEMREARLEHGLLQVTDQIFDLSRDLMLRAALFRVAPTEHVLLLVTHHIASDGWSTGILFRDIAALYEAFSTGKPSPLADLAIQYADYAVWQRGRLQGEPLEKLLFHWKKKLAGISPLELPTDRPHPAVWSSRGDRQTFILPTSLCNDLKALSRKEGATLFMTLLAVFKILLHRYAGQDDIAVGSPIAGRTRVETENLIGFLVNTLVLRTDLSGDPTFRELLKRVRETALEAYARPDVPFEQLINELALARPSAGNTLFQVMFALQNYPRQPLIFPGLFARSVEVEKKAAKFDLTLYAVEEKDGLKATFEYNTDLFDDGTIARMFGHFETLLKGVLAKPDCRLSELPLLTAAEQHRLLVEWNAAEKDYAGAKCIHALFEAQAARTPEAVALEFDGDRISYEELNARANQLAHYLQESGVGPGALVAVCMERSFEMVVALLGVLKAGGAYVPLDPGYPKERLAFVLDDAQVRVLLTQQSLLNELPSADRNFQTVCVDTAWTAIAAESREAPIHALTGEHLAYVIYTSGSTGTPKGVEITHGALTNFARASAAAVDLKAADRVLQFASIGFDTAAEEIFPSLIQGARLVLRTDSMLDSVSGFLQKCDAWGITVLDLPTYYWHEVTDRLRSERLSLPEKLRLVIIGGERAVPERWIQWRKSVGDRPRLLNTYGPTEATVVATTWESTESSLEGDAPREIPIGRPIANVRAYILDQYSRPVPIGVPGELHIGGAGVARCYLNRPELTAEKFIPDPFGATPGARLYKTGDLARYLADGNIEFVGRIDDQVKIRGFRVELGEIETSLRCHPAVREAVVLLRGDDPENSRLVAYVAANPNSAPAVGALRDFLKTKLPEYMLPAAIVLLETLPLTSSGKIARQALPAPDWSHAAARATYVAPRTPVEEALARIWREVLRLEQVGIHDNFFELGGHSMLATRVVSRARNAFAIDLPLRAIFEAPTVAGLAATIVKIRDHRGETAAPIPSLSRERYSVKLSS